MASRLLSDSLLTLRPRRPALPTLSGTSRVAALRALALLTLLSLLLFLYLIEVSQVTTAAFDIEEMQRQHHDWQERNQALEQQISEIESPQYVLRYAEAHGMVAQDKAEYLVLRGR